MAAPQEFPYTLTYKVVVEINAIDDVEARQMARQIDQALHNGTWAEAEAECFTPTTKTTLRKKDRVLKL